MHENKYLVADSGGVLARQMRLDDALLFIEAYCKKYYMEKVSLMLKLDEPEIAD